METSQKFGFWNAYICSPCFFLKLELKQVSEPHPWVSNNNIHPFGLAVVERVIMELMLAVMALLEGGEKQCWV